MTTPNEAKIAAERIARAAREETLGFFRRHPRTTFALGWIAGALSIVTIAAVLLIAIA